MFNEPKFNVLKSFLSQFKVEWSVKLENKVDEFSELISLTSTETKVVIILISR